MSNDNTPPDYDPNDSRKLVVIVLVLLFIVILLASA
jgi:hypothetical protein